MTPSSLFEIRFCKDCGKPIDKARNGRRIRCSACVYELNKIHNRNRMRALLADETYRKKHNEQSAAWMRRLRHAKAIEYNCATCSKEFTTHDRRRKYCSSECKLEHERDDQRERMRLRRSDPATAQQERESALQRLAKWKLDNPERLAESVRHGRRKHKAKREKRYSELPHTLTLQQWEQTITHFSNRCAYCGEPCNEFHRDHFIPMSRGGGYTRNNIIPACPRCNTDKNDTMPLEWLIMQEHGLITYARIYQYLQSQI